VPLFSTEKGEEGVCATGVLLEVQGKHFILTAAHIFDGHRWKSRPIPLSITDRVIGNQLFPIGEVFMRRSPTADPTNRLANDPYDSCVIDLSPETAKRITAGDNMRFLGLEQLDPWSGQDPRDWFTVAGFPGVLNQVAVGPDVLRANPCFFTTFVYCGERGNIPWTDADQGVGILLDYGQTTTEDDEGNPVAPPDPRGMSGGGMWRIARHGCDMGKWTLSDVRLIGIQSCYYLDEFVLRGTRVEHALGFIYRGHKDLQEEFNRQFGPEAARRWLY
jgi:hypothetical protein